MKLPRLPFRIKVPERDELIAFGLATLAVGLMIGLAIGPLVSGSATVISLVGPGQAATPVGTGEPQTASVPSPGPPAGSDRVQDDEDRADPAPVSAPVPAIPVAAAPAAPPLPERPQDPYTAPVDPRPETPAPEPEPQPEGTPIEGTVLANAPASKTYWVSSNGELSTVFAGSVPDPGLVISTHVTPLANGTLAESAPRSAVDISRATRVRGVVSYLDPEAGVVVLSGRGASLPVFAARPAILEGTTAGSRVEAELDLDVPDPVNYSGSDTGTADPAKLPLRLRQLKTLKGVPPVELTGSLVAADEENGALTLTADSTGNLDSVVELTTPEDFPFGLLEQGQRYSVTASFSAEALRITGFSPAFGKAAANDPARAFGTHAR